MRIFLTPLKFKKMEIGKKIKCFGHCAGIFHDGSELSCPDNTYHTVNNGSLTAGYRPKRGGKYLLNGHPVVCTQSAFSEGDADYPDVWTFTLISA